MVCKLEISPTVQIILYMSDHSWIYRDIIHTIDRECINRKDMPLSTVAPLLSLKLLRMIQTKPGASEWGWIHQELSILHYSKLQRKNYICFLTSKCILRNVETSILIMYLQILFTKCCKLCMFAKWFQFIKPKRLAAFINLNNNYVL